MKLGDWILLLFMLALLVFGIYRAVGIMASDLPLWAKLAIL